MENLNEIKKNLNEKLQENKLLIEECDANIEKTEQSIRNANDQLLEGETEVNVDKYNEAKNLLWSANHAKELYLKQREKLINTPLITKSEYQSMLSKIDKAAKDIQEEQNVRAIELIKKLKGISDESYQTGRVSKYFTGDATTKGL
jgi:DNA polymerase II small subunit/DNA polymerase delta subunit B